MNYLDTVFNSKTFLILNGAIILIGVAVGGEFLFQTGTIHLIALFFVMLSILRIFLHYYTYDRFLEKFFHYSMAAMFIFAVSHIIEFLSITILKLDDDVIYSNVANFYIVSLLLISLGAEHFLVLVNQGAKTIAWLLKLSIIFMAGLIVSLFLKNNMISLDLDNPAPYIYAAAVFIIGLFTFFRLTAVGKHVVFTKYTIRYLLAGVMLIMLASFQNIFYELGKTIDVPDYYAINLSHYFFYFALSAMFLSFQKVANLKGVYQAIREVKARNQ